MAGDVGVYILLSSNHRIALRNQVYPKQPRKYRIKVLKDAWC